MRSWLCPCSRSLSLTHARTHHARGRAGEVRVGDIVQVYLESSHTPEGLAYVSGQQAASTRRTEAVWKELQQRMEAGQTVQGG